MELAVSYLFLRRAIGLIGTLLPVAVPLGYSITTGKWLLMSSVSSYYYTDMRNVFVGGLCAVGVFLICYKYEHWDDVLATLAGLFAIGVALCPPIPPNADTLARTVAVFHVIFAAAFAVCTALMTLLLFTRSDAAPADRPPAKRTRNRIYQICGTLILTLTALAGLADFAPADFVAKVHPLFWCEALATFAFGIAWSVKGQTLWRDVASPQALAAAAT